MTVDVFSDRERMYRAAVDRLDAIRSAWEAAGSPLVTEGSMGQLVEHPLSKMLREHEAIVLRLGEPFAPKQRRGPKPSAVPSVSAAPSKTRLRVAK